MGRSQQDHSCEAALFIASEGFLDVATPTVETPVHLTLDALSSEQLSDWKLTGKLPDPDKVAYPPVAEPTPEPTATKVEESLPSKPVDQAASTDALPKTDSKPVNPKTESRFQELLAQKAAAQERADALERRLRDLEAKNTAPKPDVTASSPAAPKFPKLEAWLAQHPDADPDDYIDARVEWREQTKEAERAERAAYDAHDERIKTTITGFRERLEKAFGTEAESDAFAKTLPTLLATMKPTWALGPKEKITAVNILATEVMNSAIPDKLLTRLRDRQDDLLTVLNAGKVPGNPNAVNAPAMLRAIGRLEAQLEMAPAPSPEPVKHTSSAPKPPTTLGSKPAETVDEAHLALEQKDFTRYRKIMNAREIAAAKRTA